MLGYPKPSELLSKSWWISSSFETLNALKSGLKCEIEGI